MVEMDGVPWRTRYTRGVLASLSGIAGVSE